MKIKLSLTKNVNENANVYFDKAKKLRNKLPGLEKAMGETQVKIKEFTEQKELYLARKEKQEKLQVHKKKEWFEKFRYTWTSSGLLLVIGKDAGTNEVLLKKHMEEKDLVFHTEAPGSPFGLLKEAKDVASKEDLEEAAQFVCCFSKQWKKGFGTADAFWVYPEQVSKKAQSGEYIAKGAFMIRGTKNMLKNIVLKICIGIRKAEIKTKEGVLEFDEPVSGSEKFCRKECKSRFVKLEPGTMKYKGLNKDIKKRLKTSIDDLPKFIPNESKVLKK